jgi:hypothetical protein
MPFVKFIVYREQTFYFKYHCRENAHLICLLKRYY